MGSRSSSSPPTKYLVSILSIFFLLLLLPCHFTSTNAYYTLDGKEDWSPRRMLGSRVPTSNPSPLSHAKINFPKKPSPPPAPPSPPLPRPAIVD